MTNSALVSSDFQVVLSERRMLYAFSFDLSLSLSFALAARTSQLYAALTRLSKSGSADTERGFYAIVRERDANASLALSPDTSERLTLSRIRDQLLTGV